MDINDQNNQAGASTSTQFNADELFDAGVNYRDIIEKDILDLMGFTTLTEEKKAELHKEIERVIEERASARIYDSLDEESSDQYIALTNASKFSEANNFLLEKGIDVQKVLLEEAMLYKFELFEDSKFVRKKIAESFIEEQKKNSNDNQ